MSEVDDLELDTIDVEEDKTLGKLETRKERIVSKYKPSHRTHG
jgi:hypothetical protein